MTPPGTDLLGPPGRPFPNCGSAAPPTAPPGSSAVQQRAALRAAPRAAPDSAGSPAGGRAGSTGQRPAGRHGPARPGQPRTGQPRGCGATLRAAAPAPSAAGGTCRRHRGTAAGRAWGGSAAPGRGGSTGGAARPCPAAGCSARPWAPGRGYRGGGQRGRRSQFFCVGTGAPLPRSGTAAFLLCGHACAHGRSPLVSPRSSARVPAPCKGGSWCPDPSGALGSFQLISLTLFFPDASTTPAARSSPLACHSGGQRGSTMVWSQQVVETMPESFALQGLEAP